MLEWASILDVRQQGTVQTTVISRRHLSCVKSRFGYYLFRNPAEVAYSREARSWQFIIKRKNKALYMPNKTLIWAACSAPVFYWQFLDCSLAHWNVSFIKTESLLILFVLYHKHSTWDKISPR